MTEWRVTFLGAGNVRTSVGLLSTISLYTTSLRLPVYLVGSCDQMSGGGKKTHKAGSHPECRRYSFCSCFLPVTCAMGERQGAPRTLGLRAAMFRTTMSLQLTTTTVSPHMTEGSYKGLCLPARGNQAASVHSNI